VLSTPSAASINYVSSTGFQSGYTSEQVASGYISGDLASTTSRRRASQGVSIVLGAEYRKESLDLKIDNAFSTGDLTGQGAPTLPVSGSTRCPSSSPKRKFRWFRTASSTT
jgi:hypothetical protein